VRIGDRIPSGCDKLTRFDAVAFVGNARCAASISSSIATLPRIDSRMMGTPSGIRDATLPYARLALYEMEELIDAVTKLVADRSSVPPWGRRGFQSAA
jgi:hypothetical protein